jgi:Leucine-rich repeat (LRR) protein
VFFLVVPDSWCQLTELQILLLGNQANSKGFTRIPDCFSNLQKLMILDIPASSISNFPVGLTTIKTLLHINLAGNKIAEIPSTEISAGLKNLLLFDLSSNLISSNIPSFAGFNSLKTLSLAANKLTGCIDENYFNEMFSLTSLDLSKNTICGPLPKFVKTSQLKTINLQNNLFTGKNKVACVCFCINLVIYVLISCVF